MHPSSFMMMGQVLTTYLRGDLPLRVLDVGSMSVNRSYPFTYRELMPPAWDYAGCDIAPGPNVDFVMVSEDRIRDEGECCDVVISGQCLEHVRRPWRLVPEMARMLVQGGHLIITAPWRWEIHRHPIDCYRFLPDGLQTLIADAGLEVLKTFVNQDDCWGIGRKP